MLGRRRSRHDKQRRPCLRHAALPFLLASLLTPAARTAAQAAPVDEFIRAEMERQNIPGLSLAVLRDGELIEAKGYGMADLATRTPATPETVYRIASVSKQFVATAILLLVQEGRVGLDDPVRRHIGEAPESWNGITIRHLLSHTSGLVRNPPGFDPFRPRPDAEVIATAYGEPLLSAPGEAAEYSNLGYFVLAEIVTRAASRPWTRYLDEMVFAPLGMSATHPTNTNVDVPRRAQGYTDNDELLEAPAWTALRPSGAFLSNVLDLATWETALGTDRILTDASKREMWSPPTLADGSAAPYGLGWMVTDYTEDEPPRATRLIYHTGGMPGARSAFARFVDEGLTVIILMNLDDVDIGSIMYGVARRHPPEAPELPD